jgi:hypothetical protein
MVTRRLLRVKVGGALQDGSCVRRQRSPNAFLRSCRALLTHSYARGPLEVREVW